MVEARLCKAEATKRGEDLYLGPHYTLKATVCFIYLFHMLTERASIQNCRVQESVCKNEPG